MRGKSRPEAATIRDAENAKFRATLKEFADQKLVDEMDDAEEWAADFREAYETVIRRAREVLAPSV